jgi:predicted DNA-binding transcriptional regulator YafY
MLARLGVDMTRGQTALRRQWALIETLATKRRGLRVVELQDALSTSRATVYRDLSLLREAGVPVDTSNVNGEARVSLLAERSLPPLSPTPTQVAALRLARRALDGVAGTRAASELDALLDGYTRAGEATDTVAFASQRPPAPNLAARLDQAVLSGLRCRIRYRGARDETPRWRRLDPIGLRWVKGHLYLVAHDAEPVHGADGANGRGDTAPTPAPAPAPKTFKLDRVSVVEVLRDKAGRHPAYDERALFGRSVKTWTGDEIEVAVRLSERVARFAREYPLVHDQSIQDEPGGAVVVRARVAGVPEAMRWVLSWGQEAEALSPAALREAVRAEVEGAARRYRSAVTGSLPRKTDRRAGDGAAGRAKALARATARATGRRTDRETRVG